eukprot:2519950-Rhodomonas_salina.5
MPLGVKKLGEKRGGRSCRDERKTSVVGCWLAAATATKSSTGWDRGQRMHRIESAKDRAQMRNGTLGQYILRQYRTWHSECVVPWHRVCIGP